MVTDSRAALVTGGTGRVGGAIAARLEAEGFRVLAAGRADGDLATRGRGARARRARGRGARRSRPRRPRRRATASRRGRSRRSPRRTGTRRFGATAKGSFFVAQAAAPHLRASELGLLVLIEDVAAYQPWPLFAPHCAAKAAQAMLTRVLARALAPDVRVCGIAPGTVAVEPGQEERRAAETLLGRDRLARRRRRGGALPRLGAVRHRHALVVDGGRLLARRAETP